MENADMPLPARQYNYDNCVMEAHELCRLLPDMTAGEFKSLVDDVRKKGLVRPITLFEGKILDGRHRFKACTETGTEPRYETYTGNDPAGFVQSSCVHRSLNASQRMLIAAGFLNWERAQAKLRMKAGGKIGADMTNRGVGNSADPVPGTGSARARAGARMGVDGSGVSDAAMVIERGEPEIISKIQSGEMAMHEAKQIVKLNPRAQKRIAALPKKQRAQEIQTARARKLGCQLRDNKLPPAKQNGTAFLRIFLSGLERLAMVCAEQGVADGEAIAKKFLREMDWKSEPLSLQFDRCIPVIQSLSIIQERRQAA